MKKKKKKKYNVVLQLPGFDSVIVTENPVSKYKAAQYRDVVSMSYRALYDHLKPGLYCAWIRVEEAK